MESTNRWESASPKASDPQPYVGETNSEWLKRAIIPKGDQCAGCRRFCDKYCQLFEMGNPSGEKLPVCRNNKAWKED